MKQNNNKGAPTLRQILNPLVEDHHLFDEAHRANYASQSVLFHEGDKFEYLYYVDQGLVKLMTYLPSGRPRIVRLHGSGSLIGVGGLVDTRHEHSALAVDEVVVYKWPLSQFNRIKSETPEIYSQMLEHCHQYLKTADTWITQFSTGSIRPRVARLIRYLVNVEDNGKHDHIALLKSDEMGAILGVTPESVSRVTAEFKREGILAPVRDSDTELYSPDLDALASIAAEE